MNDNNDGRPSRQRCFEGLLIENRNLFFMKTSLRTLLIMLPLVAALFSCANDMEVVNKFIDEETEPDMVGIHFEILHSDSARLKMKLVTPLVKEFNSAKEKRREFPEGVHIWLYEITGELKAELTANRARQDMETNLFEAIGNVVVTVADGKKLETEQLFLDQKKSEIYSEKYTKITFKNGTIATGDRFSAKQDLSEYKLIKGKATIMVKEEDQNED